MTMHVAHPASTLVRVDRAGVVFWRSPALDALGVPHGFSTRHGGVSTAPFDTLNLGRAGGVPMELSDPQENRTENLRRFMHAVGIEGRLVARVHQVHGAVVIDASAGAIEGTAAGDGRDPRAAVDAHDPCAASTARPSDPYADALVSARGSQALMVTVADCAPILLACARSGVIAAVHAGWRGVIAGVVDAAIARMQSLGADGAEIRVAIGPCIGVDSFEVGDEVVDAFMSSALSDAVRRRPGARATIDLSGAVWTQLRRAGIPGEHIDCSERCTVADNRDCFSYRRDGARSGRMAAIIAPR